MEHLVAGSWGYLALFLATFISSMGIPVGSEVAIAYAGALASGQLTTAGDGHLSLALVILVATAGEVVGSVAGYAIGYYGGRPLVDRYGKYILLTHKDLDRAEAWFDGRGEWIVLFGRFVPLVRSFISLAAGLAEMTRTKFLILTVLGCAIWCTMLATLGYNLGSTWHHVLKDFSYAGYVAAALVVALIAFLIYHRLSTMKAERARHSPAAQARARDEAASASSSATPTAPVEEA